MPVVIASSKKLRDWLRKGGFNKLAAFPAFTFNATVFEDTKTEVLRQHPEETDPDLRTAYRLLTRPKPKPKVEPGVTRIELPTLLPRWLKVGFGILVLALLSVIAARSQTVIFKDEGTTRVRRAGGQVGVDFVGPGVSCAANVAGITTCTITSGAGATHQIDGVALTGQDPINFLDTSEFDWTNPAAGNLSLAIKSASINLVTKVTGTLPLGNGGTGSTSFTAGSVIFSNGTILTQDNANLFWDDTGNKLGIGTVNPGRPLHIVTSFDFVARFESTDSFSSISIRDSNTTAGDQVLIAAVADDMRFRTLNQDRMTIASAGNVGIGTAAPATSALLELSSTTGALLLTRVTTTQRDALTAVDGMVLYNSTLAQMQGRVGAAWVDLGAGAGSTRWDQLLDPTAVTIFNSGATAELFQMNFTASYGGTDILLDFQQLTGNPVAGSEFMRLTVNDPDMLPFAINDGTNTVFQVERDADTNIRNFADSVLAVRLDSGDTSASSVDLHFSDRGTTQWRFSKGGANQFNLFDSSSNVFLSFSQGGSTDVRSAGSGVVSINKNVSTPNPGTGGFEVYSGGGAPVLRTTLNANADRISFGSASDASIERTAAGILDVINVVDANTGFRIAGAAASGNYLRGNATNFVSSAILTADIQELIALADLTDVASTTGTGTIALLNSTPTIITPSFTTGFTIGGAAATDDCVLGNATNYVASAACALSSDNLSFFSATTSAQLRSVLSDEDGTGPAIFNTPTAFILDVEAGTNAITTVSYIEWQSATCVAATATSNFDDSPTLAEPAAACVAGSVITSARLDFDDTTDEGMQISFVLPTGWTGNIDFDFYWHGINIVNDVVWALETISVADAETLDPAFNTAQTVTDTAKGTANQLNIATISNVTTTGFAAGERVFLQISRDANNGSDNFVGDARLVSTRLTLRRTQ